MRKCDFCKNELTCSGVNRSECIVRDYFRFEIERTPADEETRITRLLVEAGGVFNPRAVAKHLVAHGVVMKGYSMRCSYCESETNDFVPMNQTVEYE